MNFRNLRQIYQKLVFISWRQRWHKGRLQLEFDYQLVVDPDQLAILHSKLINQSPDRLNQAADDQSSDSASDQSIERVDQDLITSSQLSYLTDQKFTHRLELGLNNGQLPTTKLALEGLIFQIGIIEAINYWKLTCPAQIELACGQLSPEQQKFWQKLYYYGLGEFMYLHQLHLPTVAGLTLTTDNIVKFTTTSTVTYAPITVTGVGNLIPVGGGKDSVVTLEVLRDERTDNLPLVMSPPQAAYDCIKVAGYTNYLVIERRIDPQLLTLNQVGFLNGHVPFSAILAFISLLAAALTNKRYIALSNENSANEPSVPGTDFNHQYSKSWQFEADFRRYIDQFVVKGVEYFSLLRPLEELQIAELFSHYSTYHPVFRSCNVGKKTNSWCGYCPKCLFVFVMLVAFLDYQQVVTIFGKDLLDDVALLPVWRQLLGLEATKPFECVGTVCEVRRAADLIVKRYAFGDIKLANNSLKLPILLQKFVEYQLDDVKLDHNNRQAVPAELLIKLQQERGRYGV